MKMKMEMEMEMEIEVECKKNLRRGRAVATGIGVFAALIKKEASEYQVLLRRRQEKDSLYSQDLSGKWEMTGGGVELQHFVDGSSGLLAERYQKSVAATLAQELEEEAGIVFSTLPEFFFMIPAWLFKKGIIDLAFVTPIPWVNIEETPEFKQKIKKGEIRFFYPKELERIEIVSPRTRFLIEQAVKYALYYWV